MKQKQKNSDVPATTHCYDIQDAIKYGVTGAVLLYNIKFWVAKNRIKQINKHNDRYWTYNTVNGFCELFPEFTSRQINYSLKQLENHGAIVTGIFNKRNMTKQSGTVFHKLKPTYTIVNRLIIPTDRIVKWMIQICQMEATELSMLYQI